MVTVCAFVKLCAVSKAEGFPSQYGRGTQLMRSETVGKEQEHANVRVSEREYQMLAWEQSSLANGKPDQAGGQTEYAETCVHR